VRDIAVLEEALAWVEGEIARHTGRARTTALSAGLAEIGDRLVALEAAEPPGRGGARSR
jgi:hypothetical protein